MGRHGVQIFNGQMPKKINQPVTQDFDKTNWVWVCWTSRHT